jgi:hypothetical protein
VKKLLIAFCLVVVVDHGAAPLAAKADRPGGRSRELKSWRASPVEQPFEIDVGALRGKVDQLRVDERREQIADWAVYGTLYQAGLPADVIRTAMYDKIPVRLPLLEAAARWDYGPGRRVILPGGDVWLFHSEYDPAPDVTVARLADRVRMELGRPPAQVRVFAFASDLASGTIRVRFVRDIDGPTLFSPVFGYLGARASTEAELSAWLEAVDDVTHVRLLPDGAVELGGRRFDQRRTLPAGLWTVATLYRAQATIDDNHKGVESYLKKTITAFNAVVSSYNASARGSGWVEPTASDSSYAEVERLIDATTSGSNGRGRATLTDDQRLETLGLPRDNRPGLSRPGLYGGMFGGAAKPEIEKLRKRIENFELAVGTGQVSIPGVGKLLPDAPGFSLDPTWDMAGLPADLALVLSQPDTLVSRARALAKPITDDDAASTPALQAALSVNEAVAAGTKVSLPPPWRKRVESVRAELLGARAPLEDGVLLDLERLSEDARHGQSTGDEAARGLITLALDSHRIQCARYDGPLQGTEVAMNLFYTDFLAKALAGLDFHRTAPVDRVLGFATVPNTAPDVEAAFWAEDLARPSTRLWFGPKSDGMAISAAGDEIDFDHIASRVYSAGSDPLVPGLEQAAGESTGRVLRWWDHHFDQIADYEQQYHLQNQIMKWSVVTSWLEAKQRLRFLATPAASGEVGRRFDRWYQARTDLRFREPLEVRSSAQSPTGTECLDLYLSRPFLANGRIQQIRGGVSLGSKRTLESAVRVNEATPLALRRAGVVGEVHSGSSRLKTAGGTTFDLPANKPTATITVAADQRLRGGGIEPTASRPADAKYS